ncbi:transposase, partial [Escherichia coli]
GTADRNRSHWSTSKTPSYTKSVSWQHHRINVSSRLRHSSYRYSDTHH